MHAVTRALPSALGPRHHALPGKVQEQADFETLRRKSLMPLGWKALVELDDFKPLLNPITQVEKKIGTQKTNHEKRQKQSRFF